MMNNNNNNDNNNNIGNNKQNTGALRMHRFLRLCFILQLFLFIDLFIRRRFLVTTTQQGSLDVVLSFHSSSSSSSSSSLLSTSSQQQQQQQSGVSTTTISSSSVLVGDDDDDNHHPPYIYPPNPNNTLITVVNMYRTNKKVQRLICSLRRRGEWDGPVLIITDTEEHFLQYTQDIPFSKYCGGGGPNNDNIYVAKAHPNDLIPTHPITGEPIKYKKDAMIYKRFKTLVWDYLEEDIHIPSAVRDPIEYILYVDSDNVVGTPLQEFLTSSYHTILHSTGLRLPPSPEDVSSSSSSSRTPSTPPPIILRTTNQPPPKLDMDVPGVSFFSTFPQPWGEGREGYQYHGGLMLNHKYYSRFCLEAWKAAFDDTENELFHLPLDQLILVQIPEYTKKRCQIQLISDSVMTFPTPEDSQNRTLNTFVHFTRRRERDLKNDQKETQSYLLHLLNVNNTDNDDDGNHSMLYKSDPMIEEVFGLDDYSLIV